jgi:hypothetical protein
MLEYGYNRDPTNSYLYVIAVTLDDIRVGSTLRFFPIWRSFKWAPPAHEPESLR